MDKDRMKIAMMARLRDVLSDAAMEILVDGKPLTTDELEEASRLWNQLKSQAMVAINKED